MKIINKTKYRTRQLRSIICAVHTKQGKWGRGRLPTWKDLEVTVTYTRGGGHEVTGRASYDGTRMRLRLPRAFVAVNRLVLVTRHEQRA